MPSRRQLGGRYFEMWNTGDSSIAPEILHEKWLDHAHPEINGPADVQRALESARKAGPGLRFTIRAVLTDSETDLVTAVGEVTSAPASQGARPTRLIWLIRLQDNRLAEMWTYRDTVR